MLLVKLVLFSGVAIYALYHGPFHTDESTVSLLIGMALVSAMAIQNGLHKAHLPKAPPSTLMTGTTTQIMLDLADLLADPNFEQVTAARLGLKRWPARLPPCAGLRRRGEGYMLVPAAAFSLPAIIAVVALFAERPALKPTDQPQGNSAMDIGNEASGLASLIAPILRPLATGLEFRASASS